MGNEAKAMTNPTLNVQNLNKNTESLSNKNIEIIVSKNNSLKNFQSKISKLKNSGAILDCAIDDVDGGYYDFHIKLEEREIEFCFHTNTWVDLKIFIEKQEEAEMLTLFLKSKGIIDSDCL